MRTLIETNARAACDEYPMAIVIYYGPKDKFISQAIVSIIQQANAKADLIHKWCADTDINACPTIAKEISAFILVHHVKFVAIMDEVIGNAHQGNIDYPAAGLVFN